MLRYWISGSTNNQDQSQSWSTTEYYTTWWDNRNSGTADRYWKYDFVTVPCAPRWADERTAKLFVDALPGRELRSLLRRLVEVLEGLPLDALTSRQREMLEFLRALDGGEET